MRSLGFVGVRGRDIGFRVCGVQFLGKSSAGGYRERIYASQPRL